MKTRKALSKKTRFEVLKRDKFTCRYCGAQAPKVILHIDHIKPVIEGGSDDLMNLITACQPCNSGKGRIPLDNESALDTSRAQADENAARQNGEGWWSCAVTAPESWERRKKKC